ncbi:MAG TPA: hypothetical protein VEB69_12515, partial [Acidimicrobiia bacterium]|nr:hypothetical protein [Acidimicrobiia bacterium]
MRVAVGVYTSVGSEVVMIDRDLNLSGGWDGSFTSQTGLSTIDGELLRRGVVVTGSDTLASLTRFDIKDGDAGGSGGGGIFAEGDLTLNASTVRGNLANNGAGIYFHGGGQLSISESTVRDNVAFSAGGGVYTSGQNGVISAST